VIELSRPGGASAAMCVFGCADDVFEHGPDRLPVITRQTRVRHVHVRGVVPTDALFVHADITGAGNSLYRDEGC